MAIKSPPADERFSRVPSGNKNTGEQQAPLSTEQDLAIDHGTKRDLVIDDNGAGAGTGDARRKGRTETAPPPGPSRQG